MTRLLFISLLAWPGAAAELRVLSFNVRFANPADGPDRWENRRDLFIDTVRSLNPDFIGTQELLQLQGDYIAGKLPQYKWFGRDRRGAHADEHMGLFYKHEQFRLVESGDFWLSETPGVVGSSSWEMSLPRMVTWGLFEPRQGARFYVLNTHFPHRGQDAEARRRCAIVLAEFLRKLPPHVPAILSGDFNTGPASDAYRELTASFKDAWTAAAKTEGPTGTFHGFKGTPGAERIDWILYRAPWSVREARTVTTSRDGRFPSDHFPVVAVFTLP
jgi:endonuclease/exonuclease/phosphatase family metal-dependent hydrolase